MEEKWKKKVEMNCFLELILAMPSPLFAIVSVKKRVKMIGPTYLFYRLNRLL